MFKVLDKLLLLEDQVCWITYFQYLENYLKKNSLFQSLLGLAFIIFRIINPVYLKDMESIHLKSFVIFDCWQVVLKFNFVPDHFSDQKFKFVLEHFFYLKFYFVLEHFSDQKFHYIIEFGFFLKIYFNLEFYFFQNYLTA